MKSAVLSLRYRKRRKKSENLSQCKICYQENIKKLFWSLELSDQEKIISFENAASKKWNVFEEPLQKIFFDFIFQRIEVFSQLCIRKLAKFQTKLDYGDFFIFCAI